MKGTKYDKFWVESILKRFHTPEKLQPFGEFLADCDNQADWVEFATAQLQTDAQVKAQREAEKKAAADKDAASKLAGESGSWSANEVSLLTKAITKYPPGTKERWGAIAAFTETKSQKECIKKATEIAKQREMDQEEKREALAL